MFRIINRTVSSAAQIALAGGLVLAGCGLARAQSGPNAASAVDTATDSAATVTDAAATPALSDAAASSADASPAADTQDSGGIAGPGQTPPASGSKAGQIKKPGQPRAVAGQTTPPAGVNATPGVSTQPLTYHTGDIAARTGSPSTSEKFEEALPRWLRFTGEFRDRVEGYENLNFKPNSSDLYDLYRLHIGMLIQPVAWMRFFIEGSDERVFEKSPAIPPYQDSLEIKKAYVEFGETEGTGFGLRAGRQELYFGNGRLIGNSWWSNVSRSFDGVRGSYEHDGYRVDAFIASVVIARDGVVNHHNQGNNLSGLYGTFKNKLVKNSQFEPYGFWHVQNGAALKTSGLGHLDEWTWGFRFLGLLPANFDYRTEMDVQRGSLGPAHISAWSGHWVFGNTLPVFLKPRPFVEYNYVSGDPNHSNANETQTFDPIYPSTHDKLGLADQIGWRNIRDLRAGLDLRPAKKWATNVSYHDFWLANAHDALYPTRGSVVAKDYTGNSGTHVGEEFDAQVIYKPTLQTQFGAGIGHLMPGRFLDSTTKGLSYTYPYFLIDYVF